MQVREFELIVIGSGAGGMTAALVGAIKGLRVLLLERASVLGGTTAISAGSAWVPNSHHDLSGGDSEENALRYLDGTVGNHAPAAMKQAFIRVAPKMVRFLEDNSEVRFRPYSYLPDYYSEIDGATVSGRALETTPFDGRLLGKDFGMLRPPLPEFTILGGMMVSRSDIANLLNAARSAKALVATVRMLFRHGVDRLAYTRGTRLVMGNALAGRFLLSLRQRGVSIEAAQRTEELIIEEGSVVGVTIEGGMRIRATHGVVLATGGFVHNKAMQEQLLPKPSPQYSAVPIENDGAGIDLGRRAGGTLGNDLANNAYWAPVSVRMRPDGTKSVFPHFALDRGKPGMIAVNRRGRRFVNEATSYQLFCQAMYAGEGENSAIPCYLMCDSRAIKKYGLGLVRPLALNLAPYQSDGYLISEPSIAGLARRLGVDPESLTDTITRYNTNARVGVDPEFAKGETRYSRNIGDVSVRPNPCVGPLEVPPFHAVALYPAPIATSCGLLTDSNARVLDKSGQAIPGLYAVGNDMNSVMGGVYAGPGIAIGSAMTFGYAAAMHAAGEADLSD